MAWIQQGGSHAFAMAGTFVIYSPPAGKNLTVRYLYVAVRTTALASPNTIQVTVGGQEVGMLSALQSQLILPLTQLIATNGGAVQVTLTGTATPTIDYAVAGEQL